MPPPQKLEKYGLSWNLPARKISEATFHLKIECECFRLRHPREKGGLGAYQHFKNIVSALWNKNTKEFTWHPWAEKMLEESLVNKYLGVLGCGSSGKTDFYAVWALVNWICDPLATKVLVTSTSLKESRKRIWGSVTEYYNAVDIGGKLVDSMGILKSIKADGSVASDKLGIELIPGEKKKEKEAIGKLIGMKQSKLILIADELPELSEAILTAFYSNLSLNKDAQLIGIGNFNSMYDPLGVFARPKFGYGSISPDDEEWETERGKCIKFDGTKSPNVLLGQDVWPIYSNKHLAEHKKLGENSAMFWRMCKSHPCPEGEQHTIYSEAELTRGKVHDAAVFQGDTIKIAFLDPGFTNDGDRSMLQFGRMGRCTDGLTRLEFTKFVQLFEDVNIKDEPRSFQIVRQFKDLCEKEGVNFFNAGYDKTGAGIAFGDVVDAVWSPHVLGVQFGGSASDLRISMSDEKVASEAYSRRVSELWYVGLEFVRSDQIRGLPTEVVKELTARHYITKKSDGNTRIEVEPKKDMKKRLGHSPDHGDAICGVIAIARERHNFLAGGVLGKKTEASDDWKTTASKANAVYAEVDYSAEEDFEQV